MDTPSRENETLLTPAEVAALFRVDPKTVTRWARSGKLPALRTLGGHRRFLESDVRALMDVPGPRARTEGSSGRPGAPDRRARPTTTSRSGTIGTASQGSGPRRAAGA
jgi:excisionase family DNA binding protein